VVYEDSEEKDLTLAELRPRILPRGANLTTDLSTWPRWALFTKIYAAIADTPATDPASFHGSNMAVLRQVFGMPRARIAIGKLKTKLSNWGKTIHPDKVQHMSSRVVRLAKLTYYALKYKVETYARLTNPHSPDPDVAPVAADYPAYGSDAFAALAGTTLDAFTQPDPEDEDRFRAILNFKTTNGHYSGDTRHTQRHTDTKTGIVGYRK